MLRRILGTFLALMVGLAAAFAQGAEVKAPIKLRFVCWDGNESSEVLKQELKRFEAKYPHIQVKFERGDHAQYFEKILTQYAAGVAPDVVMMDPANFQRFSKRGALYPLEELYHHTPGFDIKAYYPSIVAAHSYKGKLYVLPRDIAPISLIYYNKRMFREAGLPEPDGSWTYDLKIRPELGNKDFLNVVQKFQKKNENGKVVQWGFAPAWAELLIDQVVFGQGARYVDNPEDPTKVLFDDPRIIKAFQWYADMTLKEKLFPSSFDQQGTNVRQMFTQQKIAMFQSGVWEVPQLRVEVPSPDKGGFEWDIAMAPAFADGTRAYPTGGSGYAVMKSTPHPKEAWLLAEWMAGEPGMLAMARAGIAQPAIKRLALQEPWIPGPNTPPDQRIPTNRIITDTSEPYVVFAPTGILFPEVNNMARQPAGTIYTGDAKAAEVLPKSNQLAQARLDTLRKELDLPPFNWPVAVGFGTVIALALIAWIYWPELKVKRTMRQKRENRAAYLFIMPWLLGIIFFTAGPMILSLLMSFSEWDIITPARYRGVGNYVEAATIDPTFWKSLQVTLVYTIVSVPAGIIVSLGLAMLLNTKVRGIALWRTCYYIPAMASPIAASLIWLKLFQPEGGLMNTLLLGADGTGGIPIVRQMLSSVIGPNGQINWLQNESTALFSLILMSIFGAGGGMVILLAALQGVPQYYYEAATLDGAGPGKRFRNVTLPMISPAIFFSMITGFIGSFQVFTQAFQMTQGGPNNATMFFMLHAYNNAFRLLRMGYSSALAWVLFFVVLVFTVIQLYGNKFVYYEGAER
ncbi:MAG: extracellular solute-binding protein [Fimbriimonadaceae bacterium]|nr:extracellular solute-binding protein [Fimbriimonadaceae bacterium]